MTEEAQPWDDEPELEDDEDETVDGGCSTLGSWMASVAGILTVIAVVWAILGTTPKSVLFLIGVWLMTGTAAHVAEVYSG